MRPNLKVIIGVDNLQTEDGVVTDPRAARFAQHQQECSGYPFTAPWFDDPVAETGEPRDRLFECVKPGHHLSADDKAGGPPRATYRDMFVWQPEYGLPSVVGVLLPYHTHEPALSLTDHPLLWLLWLGTPTFGLIQRVVAWEVPRTQLYPYFHAGYFDRDFALAQRILERIGFSFRQEELKLLLYWYWA